MFNATPEKMGLFDAIWDHNALGAVNVGDRSKYVATLLSLLKPDGRILMSAFLYNQIEHTGGAPYSIPTDMLKTLFDKMNVEFLESINMSGTQFTERFHLSYANRLLHLITWN